MPVKRRPLYPTGRVLPLCSIVLVGDRYCARALVGFVAAALHLRQEVTTPQSSYRSLFAIEAETLAIEEQRAEAVLVQVPVPYRPVSIWRNLECGYQPTPPRCIACSALAALIEKMEIS